MAATQMNHRSSLFPQPRVMDELRELTVLAFVEMAEGMDA
jgi:hypothetical protein